MLAPSSQRRWICLIYLFGYFGGPPEGNAITRAQVFATAIFCSGPVADQYLFSGTKHGQTNGLIFLY